MRTITSLTLVAMVMVGCQEHKFNARDSKSSIMSSEFSSQWTLPDAPLVKFANASRRDATSDEAAFMVKLDTGCGGFFVENVLGKVLVATSKHCFESQDERAWCRNGTVTDSQQAQGRCERVVASFQNHDLNTTIFEVKFASEAQVRHAKRENQLRLASTIRTAGTPVKMVGFPNDAERGGKLTVTQGCTIVKAQAGRLGQSLDETGTHNCTFHEGNSGGPIIEEGTRNVVGMPVSRVHENKANEAHFALMADYVSWFHASLIRKGVVVEGGCQDAMLTYAIQVAKNRDPRGAGVEGECNSKLYVNLELNSFEDLVAKVKAASLPQ